MTDAPLSEVTFVAFDLETTGCSAAADRAVEVGAVRFDLAGRELAAFDELVNPGRPIPANVVRVHGITDAAVARAPPFAEVLPRFLDFVRDSGGGAGPAILLAHNARFDMGFVGAGLGRAGLAAPPNLVLDTVRLSRRRMPRERSHSLRNCARRFGVAETTDHRGLSDSRVLAAVFLRLVRRPPAVGTVAQLDALCGCGPLRATAPGVASSPGTGGGRRRRYDPPPAAHAALTAAVAARVRVQIVYDGGTKGAAARSVTPVRLQRRGGELYLLAWCHADDREKRYRVDRIREISR